MKCIFGSNLSSFVFGGAVIFWKKMVRLPFDEFRYSLMRYLFKFFY